MLSGSANKLAATRGSPSAVSGTSAQSVPDTAERRIAYLLRLCWFRIILALCASCHRATSTDRAGLTVAVTLFATIVLLLTLDPHETAGSTSRNTFVRLGSLFAPLVLAAPLAVAAAQHPSDSAVVSEPSVQAFPAPLLDFSYAHSSAEKTHRRSGSTGSPTKASRWASRSILNKSASSTADSAIHIMPMTPRPVVTDRVVVDVETVVDFDKETKDDYASAKSLRDDASL